jgi:hypothetical protein
VKVIHLDVLGYHLDNILLRLPFCSHAVIMLPITTTTATTTSSTAIATTFVMHLGGPSQKYPLVGVLLCVLYVYFHSVACFLYYHCCYCSCCYYSG